MIAESVIISIIVSGTVLIGYLFRLLFMSKCSNCKMGCIEVERDTVHELQNITPINLTNVMPTGV